MTVVVNLDTKRFASGETLTPGRFTRPERMKSSGPPQRLRCGEIDHALAGQNLFRIQVREKQPVLKQ